MNYLSVENISRLLFEVLVTKTKLLSAECAIGLTGADSKPIKSANCFGGVTVGGVTDGGAGVIGGAGVTTGSGLLVELPPQAESIESEVIKISFFTKNS